MIIITTTKKLYSRLCMNTCVRYKPALHVHPFQLRKAQSRRTSPSDGSVLTPTRPSLVMASTKACSKAVAFCAHATTVGCDRASEKSTWSEANSPRPSTRLAKYWLSKACGVTGSSCSAMLGSTPAGHAACRSSAYVAFIVGSTDCGWIRSANVLQCANPTVCAADKAIMSACDRLLRAKMLVSWSRLKDGGGSLPSTLVDMDTSPSSLPSSTAYDGPPASSMTSRVASARMSAHDTWLAHAGTASTAALAWMTVSKPSPARERLLGWSFSAVLFPVDTRITDASQPSTKQSWKKRRMVAPTATGCACTFLDTAARTMLSRSGHTAA
uniref:Uncharacterized protein n=1 Tax=Zea mays TaxID=4577 RepID=C0PBU1_MAIZE|nr:unknown [Zea mays]